MLNLLFDANGMLMHKGRMNIVFRERFGGQFLWYFRVAVVISISTIMPSNLLHMDNCTTTSILRWSN